MGKSVASPDPVPPSVRSTNTWLHHLRPPPPSPTDYITYAPPAPWGPLITHLPTTVMFINGVLDVDLSHTRLNLRWIKQWIGSERPITICAKVKTWLTQKKKINEVSYFVYISEKVAHQLARNMTFGLFTTASLVKLSGLFHINLFLFI